MRKQALVALAALGLALPLISSAASATTTTTVDTMPVEREDDDDFPWGILGLLGLAGLAGLKRRDDRAHVDHRTTGTHTNNRP
jgi:MYXO-CTERM domain-containing protein